MSKNEVTKSYAELMQELDHVVSELERPDIDVDAALQLYEQGVTLTKQLDSYLSDKEHKLVELKKLTSDNKE